MGGLIAATFAIRNPDLKLSGLIYSAPFFGFHANANATLGRRAGLTLASMGAEVSILI